MATAVAGTQMQSLRAASLLGAPDGLVNTVGADGCGGLRPGPMATVMEMSPCFKSLSETSQSLKALRCQDQICQESKEKEIMNQEMD